MTYQAITTKYLGPTNVRGSRVKATAAAGSITLEWDDRLNSDQNHAQAAYTLAEKYGWQGAWFGGMTHAGEHVFCCSMKTGEPDFTIEQQKATA